MIVPVTESLCGYGRQLVGNEWRVHREFFRGLVEGRRLAYYNRCNCLTLLLEQPIHDPTIKVKSWPEL
jgi:hypothetical protein